MSLHPCAAPGCTKPTGYKFCRVHRAANARKARARRQSNRVRAVRIRGLSLPSLARSAPAASEGWYESQKDLERSGEVEPK